MSYGDRRFVYEIRCAYDESVYVGSTRDAAGRWNEHLWSARSSLRPLYAAMRKWGMGSFAMSVIASFTDHYEALAYERHRKQELMAEGANLLSADRYLSFPRRGAITWLDKHIILVRHALAMAALEASR